MEGHMENLNQLIDGYKQLFYKTGNAFYFLLFRNMERLNANLQKQETIESEQNLSL